MNERWKRLFDFTETDGRVIVGLMSGMSMDGVDLACVRVTGTFPELQLTVRGTHFRPYPAEVRARLLKARQGGVSEVSTLNVLVAQEFAACVKEFIAQGSVAFGEIHAIASHGQTLYHQSVNGGEIASSLQVGSLSIIAELTGLPCIGNFRARDLAVGGQGAPLVSLVDYVLFRRKTETIALNNLGSISNATVVPPQFSDLIGYDLGPANLVIDHFARKVPGNADGIDRDGAISVRGQVQAAMLARLMEASFLRLPPPKAAGYGNFGPEWFDQAAALCAQAKPEDLVRTAVEFCAQSTAEAYRDVLRPRFPTLQKIIFSGGGTHNRTLMARFRDLLTSFQVETMAPAEADSKEAVAFALLGYQTLCGQSSNVPQSTGASKGVVLGEIAF